MEAQQAPASVRDTPLPFLAACSLYVPVWAEAFNRNSLCPPSGFAAMHTGANLQTQERRTAREGLLQ